MKGVNKYVLKQEIEAIEVSWENWNELCDLLPNDVFVSGVYLSDSGEILTDNKTSNTMGLIIKLDGYRYVLPQGDYVVKVNDKYYPISRDVFKDFYKLL